MATITIKEARKILGKEVSDKLSDEELQQTISDLEAIARMTLKSIQNGEIKDN